MSTRKGKRGRMQQMTVMIRETILAMMAITASADHTKGGNIKSKFRTRSGITGKTSKSMVANPNPSLSAKAVTELAHCGNHCALISSI